MAAACHLFVDRREQPLHRALDRFGELVDDLVGPNVDVLTLGRLLGRLVGADIEADHDRLGSGRDCRLRVLRPRRRRSLARGHVTADAGHAPEVGTSTLRSGAIEVRVDLCRSRHLRPARGVRVGYFGGQLGRHLW